MNSELKSNYFSVRSTPAILSIQQISMEKPCSRSVEYGAASMTHQLKLTW